MKRIVIIGSGVAAIAAAEAAAPARAQAATVTILCEDPAIYYSRPGLAYFLSAELNEDQLYPYRAEDYQALNAVFLRGTALRIHPQRRQVEAALEGSAGPALVDYDCLLIATGARAVPLRVPGADLRGVCKLDHMQDARRLVGEAKRGRVAVVTGGGITALELAEGLAARHMRVHYVLRGERYWPAVLDPRESRIIESRLERAGIRLHHNREIVEITGAGGRVSGVRLNTGEQIACHLVAYAIGVAPRIELAREAGLACDRGVLVDESLRASLPGIYCAGDAAQVYDPAAGRHVLDSLWPLAREQGRCAGVNMLSPDFPRPYQKPVPFNVTRLAGLTTTIIGQVGSGRDSDLQNIARGDSETWRALPGTLAAQSDFDANHLRLVVGERHLLGAVLMGDQRLSPALQRMVREAVDITPIRARLLAPGAPVADILAEFWAARAPAGGGQ